MRPYKLLLSCSLSNVDSCKDNDGNCPAWKKSGACQTHPDVMTTWCLHSCNFCNGELCTELSCDQVPWLSILSISTNRPPPSEGMTVNRKLHSNISKVHTTLFLPLFLCKVIPFRRRRRRCYWCCCYF